MTSSTPTPQDEPYNNIWTLIEVMQLPNNVKATIQAHIDRTVAERVLAIIGEDEKRPDFINHNSRSDTKRRGRNELRAELRAAVQTQGESNE